MSSQIKNQIQLYHRLIEHRNGFILEYSKLQTLTFDTYYPPYLNEQSAQSSLLSFELIFVLSLLIMLPILVFIAYHYGKKMGKKENNPPETEVSNSSCLMLQHGVSSKSTRANISDSYDKDGETFAQLDKSVILAQSQSNEDKQSTFQEEISYQKELSPIEINKIGSDNKSLEEYRETESPKRDDLCQSDSTSEEGGNNLVLLSPQNESNTDLKVEFTIKRSSETEEHADVSDDIYAEKLRLHTDKNQIKMHEVKFGLTVENRNGLLQKIETKKIRTTYTEGADEPEKNATLVKRAYETYKQNPKGRKLFIPLPQDKEDQAQSRSLVPFNTPQIITGNLDLSRHFSFPDKVVEVTEDKKVSKIVTDITPSIQSDLQISKLLEREDFPHETGKFRKIFKNVERIGEGSFGEVYRVVHKLDGKNYAVKKVKLRLGRFEDIQKRSKVFREVFAMTDLHHANIVRYSTCWVEIDNEKSSRLSNNNQKKLCKSEVEPKGITEESESELEPESGQLESRYTKSSCVGFEWEANEGSEKSNKCDSYCESSQKLKTFEGTFSNKKSSNVVVKTLSNTVIEDELDNTPSASNFSQTGGSEYLDGHKLYLYIQMEYCAGQNLRNYLDAPDRKVCREKLLKMFKKLLEGVDAIHKRGILHRDLKPANIFLDGNENVKIGDFGLASLDHIEESPGSNSMKKSIRGLERSHSMRIGTPMYTSPEQENGGRYNHKTDIYSMGLIFYEMLENFSTHHQRYQLFNLIRRNHEISSKFKASFPMESELILKMTALHPEERPNTEELIEQIERILQETSCVKKMEEIQSDDSL